MRLVAFLASLSALVAHACPHLSGGGFLIKTEAVSWGHNSKDIR